MKVRAYHRDERRKAVKYNARQVVGYILGNAWTHDKPLFALMAIYTLRGKWLIPKTYEKKLE